MENGRPATMDGGREDAELIRDRRRVKSLSSQRPGKRFKMSRNQRVRVVPDYYEDDELYLDDVPEMEGYYGERDYYLIQRQKRMMAGRSSRARLPSPFYDEGSEARGQARSISQLVDDGRPRRTEIMYIRSPLHEIQEDQLRSVSEAEVRTEAEHTDVEEGRISDKSRVAAAERKFNTVPRGKVETGLAGRSSSVVRRQVTFTGQEMQGSKVMEKRDSLTAPHVESSEATSRREKSNRTGSASGSSGEGRRGSRAEQDVLPGSVESDSEGGSSFELDQDLIAGVVTGSDTHLRRALGEDSPKSVLKVETGQERRKSSLGDHSGERSDTDSGIERTIQISDKKMNLKNSELMQKKSVFTIAYDGVRTDRLMSATSMPATP